MARKVNVATARFELRVPPSELAEWQSLADAEGVYPAQLVRRTMAAAVERAKERGVIGSKKKTTG